MAEYVTVKGPTGARREKATDLMLDELSAVNKGWQAERDYIRTVLEVHYHAANPDSRAMITALLKIVKGAHG